MLYSMSAHCLTSCVLEIAGVRAHYELCRRRRPVHGVSRRHARLSSSTDHAIHSPYRIHESVTKLSDMLFLPLERSERSIATDKVEKMATGRSPRANPKKFLADQERSVACRLTQSCVPLGEKHGTVTGLAPVRVCRIFMRAAAYPAR